jgi:hypothetical protein
MAENEGAHLDDALLDRIAERLLPMVLDKLNATRPWRRGLFVASPEVYLSSPEAPFMRYSSCSAADFMHPRFAQISSLIGLPPHFHRKFWEWVFVVHHLTTSGVVAAGRRGLVFGVGQELLPAIFAEMGAFITATDAPAEIGIGSGWQSSGEFATELAALPCGRMDRREFEKRVEWQECDMNAISPSFTDYDFCWSSCCLEHLGNLRLGLEFIKNSVEKTLKIGGVAVHTTELNLSSNRETLSEGPTVLYRRRDLEEFVFEMRGRGHQVSEFIIAPDSFAVDSYVDTPPFIVDAPHLKLELAGYTSTSAGLVITRRQ